MKKGVHTEVMVLRCMYIAYLAEYRQYIHKRQTLCYLGGHWV